MIAKLTGVLDSIGDGWVVVETGGVGYLVFCSARTLRQVGTPGGPISVLIDTHVREDHIHLYGFPLAEERTWFRLLQTVQGVGSKMALGVLDSLSADQLVEAILAQDAATLTRANGVGPKLAKRLVSELKDKIGELAPATFAGAVSLGGSAEGDVMSDAISALVNLGYRRVEAFGAVSRAHHTLGASAEVAALIREGLKELAQ
ncbi:MAG: Holliday junction branch migration protein RuvA [Proteobacteria bacterium]|nr:Holliday junction branch migration protein RuvA [Pseudomonadota bacterium]